MALQLTGAAKRESIANLQIRLPVVVVGGGLTAIDTATESLAYYAVQVEKFLARYEQLGADISWSAEERQIAGEFLAHARALRAARPEERLGLLKSWGGVTIAYRRRLVDSPSYTLNHEEVEKALEEGISFAEGLSPTRIEVDEHGHARAVRFAAEGKEIELPARSARRQILPGLRRSGPAGQAGAPCGEAAAPRRASASAQRRALHELLRRPSPLLLRQCGQGHGERQTRLSHRQPGALEIHPRIFAG
jgi:NADPH-dependent glutamate synthase beta subunit-like oxidoreductase